MCEGPDHCGWSTAGQVVLDCIRKQAEQVLKNKPASSVPPWFLLQFLCWLPCTIDYNCKMKWILSSQVEFGQGVLAFLPKSWISFGETVYKYLFEYCLFSLLVFFQIRCIFFSTLTKFQFIADQHFSIFSMANNKDNHLAGTCLKLSLPFQ